MRERWFAGEVPLPHNSLEAFTPCQSCREARPLPFDFTMAFQPIVDVESSSIYAYETLVRGLNGEGAGAILGQVNNENRYTFDQQCRVKSVELASRLGVDCNISINFLPNAVYKAETCIQATLKAAHTHNFPLNNLIFEITENEKVVDHDHLKSIIREYKRQGFKTAIDDFGAGYSGLQLLVEFQPDLIKLDMGMLRGIDKDPVRQAIVSGVFGVTRTLGIEVIAEGVETPEELDFLRSLGIRLFQGYLFARPAVASLPEVNWLTVSR